jgi:hypothetical protein
MQTVVDLTNHLLTAINEFAEKHDGVSVGEVLSAAFSVLMNVAAASPDFDPRQFAVEFNENLQNVMDARLH